MSNLTLEIKEQRNETPVFADRSRTAAVALTPPIDEGYWQYRVMLSDRQAIVGFPKFMTIGIGFAVEEDWNTNLPYTCGTEEIYEHIAHNKGDDSIWREDCLAAIRMIQEAATADRARRGSGMFASDTGTMADTAGTAVPQPGCRSRCGICSLPIEVVAADGRRRWVHIADGSDDFDPPHPATPVEQPEPTPAEQLMASVTVSYERHRRLRPVRALDIDQMVARFADAVTDRNHAVHLYGFGTPEYERLRRLARWRRAALVRLAEALERQAGGGRELTGEDRAECAHEAAMKRLEDV